MQAKVDDAVEVDVDDTNDRSLSHASKIALRLRFNVASQNFRPNFGMIMRL